MISENQNARLSVSFSAVISMYILGFWFLNVSSVSVSQKLKLITNVEFLKFEKPAVPAPSKETVKQPVTAPAPVPVPVKAAPAVNAPKTNTQAPLDMAAEPVKKEAPRIAISEPEKLEERKEPVHRLPTVRLEELKQERDAKLNDLMDMTKNKGDRVQKLITQEQGFTERSAPLPKPGASIGRTEVLQEVGTRRVASAKITDIAQPEAQTAKTAVLDTPGDSSPLIEKKRMLKMQLAALGNKSAPLPDAQPAPRRENITDITGTLKERQKAKEIVELQKIIDAQEPAQDRRSRPAKRNLDALAAGDSPEKITEKPMASVKELPAESRGGIPVKKQPAPLEKNTLQEVKKSAMEISGPLKRRKLISSAVPPYPEWARRKGIEADVMLKFYVDPRGFVTADITVVRTSGYRELDALSIETLKKWIFAPLGENEPRQDQWGAVTMRYILE